MIKKYIKRITPNSLHPSNIVVGYIKNITNKKVISGPFQSTEYIDGSFGSVYTPKLLGTYEKELHPLFDDIMINKYRTIIDVGAAEGYYAVGLARKKFVQKVIAFEADEYSRTLLSQMININDVKEKVIIYESCTLDLLKNEIAKTNSNELLIIMDVEGFEETLLNPCDISSLKYCTILVEVHDFINPSISGILKDRFARSHNIETINEKERNIHDYPFNVSFILKLFFSKWLVWAIKEHRPEKMFWFVLRPK
jgi:hypothetical protein